MSHGRPRLAASVDERIKPGDDFFAYANGSWLATTTIPAGKERWGARDEINVETLRRVAKLIEDTREAPRETLARKVGDFRAAPRGSTRERSRRRASLH